MKSLHYIFYTCILSLLITSCKSEPTLQTYFVDHQEAENFTTIDLPVSMLSLDESKLTEDQKQTVKSIKHLNFLGYKKSDKQLEAYNTELAKVGEILKNKSYNDLMDAHSKHGKFTLKYMGDDETAIDELIVFASSDELGFGVLRVLGDDMKPSQIIKLGKALEAGDFDSSQLNDVVKFFHSDSIQ